MITTPIFDSIMQVPQLLATIDPKGLRKELSGEEDKVVKFVDKFWRKEYLAEPGNLRCNIVKAMPRLNELTYEACRKVLAGYIITRKAQEFLLNEMPKINYKLFLNMLENQLPPDFEGLQANGIAEMPKKTLHEKMCEAFSLMFDLPGVEHFPGKLIRDIYHAEPKGMIKLLMTKASAEQFKAVEEVLKRYGHKIVEKHCVQMRQDLLMRLEDVKNKKDQIESDLNAVTAFFESYQNAMQPALIVNLEQHPEHLACITCEELREAFLESDLTAELFSRKYCTPEIFSNYPELLDKTLQALPEQVNICVLKQFVTSFCTSNGKINMACVAKIYEKRPQIIQQLRAHMQETEGRDSQSDDIVEFIFLRKYPQALREAMKVYAEVHANELLRIVCISDGSGEHVKMALEVLFERVKEGYKDLLVQETQGINNVFKLLVKNKDETALHAMMSEMNALGLPMADSFYNESAGLGQSPLFIAVGSKHFTTLYNALPEIKRHHALLTHGKRFLVGLMASQRCAGENDLDSLKFICENIEKYLSRISVEFTLSSVVCSALDENRHGPVDYAIMQGDKEALQYLFNKCSDDHLKCLLARKNDCHLTPIEMASAYNLQSGCKEFIEIAMNRLGMMKKYA